MAEPVTESQWTAEALRHAVQAPDSDPIPTLLEALTAPDADVRREAVRYLTEMPTHRAVFALAHVLRADPEDDIRWETAEALGIIGHSSAIPSLLGAITDICPAVRLCVAEALGMIGSGDSRVAAALCCLLTDFDSGVRMFTLEALGDLGIPTGLPALPAIRTRLAAERLNPEVRVWVYYALDRLGESPFPLTEAISLLRRGSTRTRVSTARALCRLATLPAPSALHRIRRALHAAHARETSIGMRECMANFLNDLP